MTGYTKLFSSIITSTIWSEDDATRIVWITMLAVSDKNGEVQGSVPGLARLAGVPVETCRAAIDKFLGPDPDSRTKDDDGRRIEVIEGGWHLLNHAKYRAMASEEETRIKAAVRQQRHREKQKRNGIVTDSNGGVTWECGEVTPSNDIQKLYPEAKAGTIAAKPRVLKQKTVSEASASTGAHAEFITFWTAEYPKHHHNEPYAFQGGKDGTAVKALLLSSQKPVPDLMRVAVAAWKHPSGFHCKAAASISGFASRFNDIRAELNVSRGNGTAPVTQPVAAQCDPDGWAEWVESCGLTFVPYSRALETWKEEFAKR